MANGILAASQLEMLSQAGTGITTIIPPATNTNRSLTLPDSTGTVATAESTLAQFNASGSAPVYAARAWVNFNGTGTVAIRASGNVSSITDNGTGDYTVNFTTAMPDVNYANTFGSNTDAVNGNFVSNMGVYSSSGAVLTKTTSALRIAMKNQSWIQTDATEANIAVFR